MSNFTLYPYQEETVLKLVNKKRSGAFLDMGLGKTYVAIAGAKIVQGNKLVIVCPKIKLRQVSKDDDSGETMVQQNFDSNYKLPRIYTQKGIDESQIVIVNYDILHKCQFPSQTTYIFDEVQKAKNHTSKRGKATFKCSQSAKQVLCLSGDPYPQGYKDCFNLMKILQGENLSYRWFKNRYLDIFDNGVFPMLIGYKNTDEIRHFMNRYGVGLKTEQVTTLPPKVFIPVVYESPTQFKEMLKTKMVTFGNQQIVGELPITQLTYLRELSSSVIKIDNQYHYLNFNQKIEKVKDIIDSTNDNLIIFYNFIGEKISLLRNLEKDYQVYCIDGQTNQKQEFLDVKKDKAILLCQYQSASSAIDGLQTQSHHLICYSPTQSGENWKQMIKRIHRIGQLQTCYYYLLQNQLESKIYHRLEKFENYTLEMFIEDFKNE